MKNKFDPFKIFPEEICDEILAYLNVENIKEASLVSKHWYNMIGRSKSCMYKLCLKPTESYRNHEFFMSILNSTRMYQNMEMFDRFNKVMSNTKYLRLMREVVAKLASTLVSLKLSNDLIIKVDLPKLKELEFDAYNYSTLIAANGLLTKAKGLEKLTVNCWNIDKKSLKYLRNFLVENDSLKMLKNYDNRLFHGLNSSNVKFRLQEFFTGFKIPLPFEFFKVHSDSLKITKSTPTRDSITFFMTNFSQLHTLIIKGFWNHNESFDIPFNTTIRKLKFDVFSYFLQNSNLNTLIIELIKKVQNLEEIELDFINSQILRALINCRTLKTVKFRTDNLTRQDHDEMQIHENINFVLF
ncbi:hypothetical protein ACKWTF_003441 [Chironomus riparius]